MSLYLYGETMKPVENSSKYDQWKLAAPEYEEPVVCDECKFFRPLKDNYGACIYEDVGNWIFISAEEQACESYEEN